MFRLSLPNISLYTSFAQSRRKAASVMQVTSHLFKHRQSKCLEGPVDDRAHFSSTWQGDPLGRLRLRGAFIDPLSLRGLPRRGARSRNLVYYVISLRSRHRYRVPLSLHSSWQSKSLTRVQSKSV